LKREIAELRPAGTGGSRRGEGLVGGIEVEEEGRGGGERGKEKEKIPAIKSRWRGLGSADSRKTRVKFLIQAEILGISALRSVIGAAFIHTRNSHLFQSPPSSLLFPLSSILHCRRHFELGFIVI
jgi:hypothetical protein